MTITNFTPDATGTKLILDISNASTVYDLKLWTDITYKNYQEAIDLTSKLTNDSTQSIEILASDINESYLNGAYFIQVASSTEILEDVIGYYNTFEECILNELMNVKLCDDCLENESLRLLNVQTILLGFKYAIDKKFMDEIKSIGKSLRKFCNNDCKSCGNFNNITYI